MGLPKSLSVERVLQAAEADDNTGFCVACGCEHQNIEPDARNYTCTNCGSNQVYGAEEILIQAL